MTIELQNIYKAFGDLEVLRGVSLKVPAGKTLCIIGGSGTGKSVTMKHMVGLLKPDKGRVFVDGEDITDFTRKELIPIRRKFGVLFQSAALLKWLTVFENVALPLRELSNTPEEEIEKRVMTKLELLGIEEARDKIPDEISGGMKKRAGLARSLIWDPQYILYDEPTSGLDPVVARRVDQMIMDTQKRLGVTSVVVTHDMGSAYRIGDEIAMLYQGEIIQKGPPEAFQNTDNPIVRQFVEGNLEGPITDDDRAGKTASSSATNPESPGEAEERVESPKSSQGNDADEGETQETSPEPS